MEEDFDRPRRRDAVAHAALEINFENVRGLLRRQRRTGRRDEQRMRKADADVSEGVNEPDERARAAAATSGRSAAASPLMAHRGRKTVSK